MSTSTCGFTRSLARSQWNGGVLVAMIAALALAVTAPAALAATTTIEVIPSQVPDEQWPRGNVGDAPAGFGPDSWQGPFAGKSNWHARYLLDGDHLSALFPDDAATMTIADLASISYFTKRPAGTPAGRDWWIQIYTRPTGSLDCSGWYKNRFINNYDAHTATGSWTQYSTDAGAMTFNKNACGVGPEQTLTDLITNHGTELIEMISIQTDSGWNGFGGYVDGLVITHTNGNVGRVNLETSSITIQVAPWQVPDEKQPRVNVGDAPTGFGPDSWQGPSTGKTNWHARYLSDFNFLSTLFPDDAATMTIADLKAISYFTKRPAATPAGRDWWVHIYTRPFGTCVGAPPCDKASWYHDRYISNYATHTETGVWTQYSTDSGMTFQSNGHGGPVKTLAQLIADHGTELIEMISIQTNSGWNGFDGYVDGLEVTLTNGNVGRVNMGATCDESGYTFYVDPAGSDVGPPCLLPVIPCATIQHAVDLACPGNTINVAAGTYVEQVRIAKSLDLVGAGEATTTIEAPPKASRVTENANHGFGLRTYDYLVGVFGTGSETVNISGFTLDGKNDAKSSGAPVPPATAFRSQQLTFFNSNGTIEDNTLIDWQDPAAFGAQGVATLASGSITPVTVNVRGNVVTGYQKTGIVAFGSAAVTATIEGNVVTGAGPIGSTAQNGIQMSNGAVGSIVGNDVRDNNYTGPNWCASGILLISDGVTVQDNTLTGSLCDLMIMSNGSTIRGNVVDPALDYPFSVLGNNNTVDMNVVNGSPGAGVYNDGTGNAYTCNRITNNAGGFYFDNYSGAGTPNLVNDNFIAGNGVGVDASAVAAPPDIDATGNWWGCPAGPGNPGCDSVTANVDASSPLAAPPACVSCSSDADCDDTLACTGVETCNTGTNMCAAGTSVVCSGQCLTGACLEPSGTCEPKPNGTVCTLAPACSVDDTCQSGVCTLGTGGADGDSDTVCDADDNCPADPNTGQEDLDGDLVGDVCDDRDGNLNLTHAKLRRARPGKTNGSVGVKGDFYGPPPDSFSATLGITVEVTDNLGFSMSHTWTAGECPTSSSGRVSCKSPDKNFQGKFKPFRATPYISRFNVKFKKQAIPADLAFDAPVTVRLSYNGPPVVGTDREGSVVDCKATSTGLNCRVF